MFLVRFGRDCSGLVRFGPVWSGSRKQKGSLVGDSLGIRGRDARYGSRDGLPHYQGNGAIFDLGLVRIGSDWFGLPRIGPSLPEGRGSDSNFSPPAGGVFTVTRSQPSVYWVFLIFQRLQFDVCDRGKSGF